MLEKRELLPSNNQNFINSKIFRVKKNINNNFKFFFIIFLIIYSFIISIVLFIYSKFNFKKINLFSMFKFNNSNNKIINNSYIIKNRDKNIANTYINIDIINDEYKVPDDENFYCKRFDPFKLIEDRLKKYPIEFCDTKTASHICYKNQDDYFNKKNGLICKMINVVIDPSKWKSSGLNFSLGPVDNKTYGFPLLSKGFFNIDCKSKLDLSFSFNSEMYSHYINSWNYGYKSNEKYEELAPNKTVFFVSRNQDSPNIFFGGSGIINALALIKYLNLKPENIQVVFLESMFLNRDPSYIFYKNLISRGGEPIHIRNLTKKYHISNAIHVPIMWDSPLTYRFFKIPTCKYQSKAYYYLNQYVNKYINISEFHDTMNYDNQTFYYSKTVKDPSSSIYKKFLTFQWRRQYPKGRKGQVRILGNGPEIVEKLVEKLPKNILVRLVDTAKLSMVKQISIIKKTDYFLGIHGAGLFLSAFMPTTSILHEISTPKKTINLLLVSNLSGHKTFSDILNATIKTINDCEYQFYDPDQVLSSVLKHMNETNFFN